MILNIKLGARGQNFKMHSLSNRNSVHKLEIPSSNNLPQLGNDMYKFNPPQYQKKSLTRRKYFNDNN